MKEASLSDLTFARFAEAVGSAFKIHFGNVSSAELCLAEVNPENAASNASAESFSLIFSGSPDRILPQATYMFEHDTIGAFALFIVPIGKDARALYYEAIFNRVIEKVSKAT